MARGHWHEVSDAIDASMHNREVALQKRTEHGGESMVFWANSATQAALRRQAEQRGVSPAVAARQIVQEWLREHDPEYVSSPNEGETRR